MPGSPSGERQGSPGASPSGTRKGSLERSSSPDPSEKGGRGSKAGGRPGSEADYLSVEEARANRARGARRLPKSKGTIRVGGNSSTTGSAAPPRTANYDRTIYEGAPSASDHSGDHPGAGAHEDGERLPLDHMEDYYGT